MADDNRTTYTRTNNPPPHRDAPRTTVRTHQTSTQQTGNQTTNK